MNPKMVSILFLKDLFLSRRMLFAYLMAGLASAGIACWPNEIVSFVGFLLVVTVCVGMGMHMIGELILEERKSNTLSFILTLPVDILDYSYAKIAVVLMTFLIPWGTMLMGTIFLIAVLPSAKDGSMAASTIVFLELFASFTIQLVVAVVTESLGWTIAVMVLGNVFFNLFIFKLFRIPEIAESLKSDLHVWTPLMSQIVSIEMGVIVLSIVVALVFQSHKRNFV